MRDCQCLTSLGINGGSTSLLSSSAHIQQHVIVRNDDVSPLSLLAAEAEEEEATAVCRHCPTTTNLY